MARPTPSPTPSPTPFLNLDAENSITPVTCNGSGKSVAGAPFLMPPYHGWTSLVSYFDHDSPNFSQDGLVVTTTGAEARPDSVHEGSGFPAYWDASLRQYLYYDGHNGYDYDLSYQPIYAAAAGKVIFADWEYPTMPDHGYGRMVMIAHSHGYVTLYGHFSKILVHVGERVRQGQRIGTSGNTGHSTGPHLHFTVFHNCTPVDPYGWNGQGPDPLAAYQGESSTYLWKTQPLLENPAPGWPKLSTLPGSPFQTIVLLALPRTDLGTRAFSSALRSEAQRARAAIERAGASARLDLERGALIVTGQVTPGQVLSLPDVVSITTPDTVEGERADVLEAVARAAAVDRQKRLNLNGSRRWTGRLMRWEGHVLLVGKGVRNASVTLRLSTGRGGAAKTVHTDPETGAYAIDLGPLTNRQEREVERNLTAHRRRSVVSTTTNRKAASHVALSAGRHARTPPWVWGTTAVVVFALLAGAAVLRARRGAGLGT